MADDSHVLSFHCPSCRSIYKESGADIRCPSCGAAPSGVVDFPGLLRGLAGVEYEVVVQDKRVDGDDDEKPKWEGWARGKSYGEDWPDIRKQVLERDDYRCQECGISHEEHKDRDDLFPPGKGLHIHHSVPFRKFESPSAANKSENLVSLCANCHARANEQTDERPPG